jgi:hypothetical protein
VKQSPHSGPRGWIDVDKHTLRHTRFDNVFALGDATDTPNAKNAAAVRKQAPVVAEGCRKVQELSRHWRQRPNKVTRISSILNPSGNGVRPRMCPSAFAGRSINNPQTRHRAW